MSRRLFHGFEQGIEGLSSEHVDFINDADPLPPPQRRDHRPSDHLFGFIDTTVRSTIELLDIKIFAPKNGFTDVGQISLTFGGVDRRSEDAGTGGLANPAGATKEVRVGDSSGRNRLAQGRRNRLLADEIFEAAWAVATSKNGVRHKKSFSESRGGRPGDPRPGRSAYGCCGQALTRFTAVPPAGPDRPLRESRSS